MIPLHEMAFKINMWNLMVKLGLDGIPGVDSHWYLDQDHAFAYGRLEKEADLNRSYTNTIVVSRKGPIAIAGYHSILDGR